MEEDPPFFLSKEAFPFPNPPSRFAIIFFLHDPLLHRPVAIFFYAMFIFFNVLQMKFLLSTDPPPLVGIDLLPVSGQGGGLVL